MRPEIFLFLLKLLFCMVVLATGGKNKRTRRQDNEIEEDINICDIQQMKIIFCYCDETASQKAEEGNCWIFDDTTKEEYQGIWEWYSSQSKIKRLTLHLRADGTLKFIPTVAIQHLPDIELFEVQYATIQSIDSFSFGNSSTLSKISLSRNSINTLARFAFANLPLLDSISLGENQITEINRRVFSNLPSLTKLYIDRNNITTIHEKAFQSVKNLVELELFANKIQVITSDTFKGLTKLERLDLHKNRLEVIGDRTFADLESLQVLDLQENSLKYIAPEAFFGLTNLLNLNLQDNKLTYIGENLFKFTPNIYQLDIRANILETLTARTVAPLMKNLKNSTMMFFLEGNNFRCDNRLEWMFQLRNSTESRSVHTNLDQLICYLEAGTLPPRLEGETVTQAYESTTLGIGPMTRLFALHEHELPDPTAYRVKTEEPDCEDEIREALKEVERLAEMKEKEQEREEEVSEEPKTTMVEPTEQHLERKRIRGRGRKKMQGNNPHQNDKPMPMEKTVTQSNLETENVQVVAPAPIQEESRSYGAGNKAPSSTSSATTILALFSVLFLVTWYP